MGWLDWSELGEGPLPSPIHLSTTVNYTIPDEGYQTITLFQERTRNFYKIPRLRRGTGFGTTGTVFGTTHHQKNMLNTSHPLPHLTLSHHVILLRTVSGLNLWCLSRKSCPCWKNSKKRLQIKSIMHIGSRVSYAKWHRIFVCMIIFGTKLWSRYPITMMIY